MTPLAPPTEAEVKKFATDLRVCVELIERGDWTSLADRGDALCDAYLAQQEKIERLNEVCAAACDALGQIQAKPYRAEEVVMRWVDERTRVTMARRAALSAAPPEGKP